MKVLKVICFLTLLSFTFKAQVPEKAILQEINEAKILIESDVPTALALAHSAFKRSKENNFDKGIAESYIVVGRCYIQTGDKEAQKILQTAIKYVEKTGDKALISDCYFYLGKSYFVTGENELQLEWYNKAFEIRKEMNDQKRLADSYHAYGNLHLALNEDSLAESYFISSKNIRSVLNDMSGLAALFNNLAIIAGNRGDTIQYRKLMRDAIQLNEQTGNKRFLSINHGNLGMSYYDSQNYDSAWQHCIKAFDIRKANDFKDHLAGSYTDLGKIKMVQKKYTEAIDYFKHGVELAKSISGTEWLIGNYEFLAETYTKMDSAKQAQTYKELAEQIKKAHEDDTLLTKKIPLPPGFDIVEPEPNSNILLWILGGATLLVVGATLVLMIRKRS